jgi:hypothetical protein
MKRPNRKDYIKKASIIQLLADLEIYIDYLEAENKQLTLTDVVDTSVCDDCNGNGYEIDNNNNVGEDCGKCG